MSDEAPPQFFGANETAFNYGKYLEPVIFAPWARVLLDFVALRPGETVLDVASGTGVVARAAAAAVGPSGRVIASDISPAMLAQNDATGDPSWAPIELMQCSATDIPLPDDSVEVVLCQQGFPFMPDRVAVAREMRRVLRPGGRVAVAIWAKGARLDPLDAYAEAIVDAGLQTEFGNVASNEKLSMSQTELESALLQGGFQSVVAETVSLEVRFASLDDAANGILGTPLGVTVAGFDAARREDFMAALRSRLAGPDGQPAAHPMRAALARGIA